LTRETTKNKLKPSKGASMKTLCLVLALTLLFTTVGCNSSHSTSTGNDPKTPDQPEDPTGGPGGGKPRTSIEFESLGIIREFGGIDTAALFAVRSKSGPFKVTKVMGPRFIKTYMVGLLDPARAERLFTKGSKPLSQAERAELLSKFSDSTVIYAEGYEGSLCTDEELKYQVIATGTVDTTEVEVAFQFEALPNSQGNCQFHIFGIQVRSTH
jgi:hypothetical protein